jgi:hypothetical protein
MTGRTRERLRLLLVPLGYCALFTFLFAPALFDGRVLAPGDAFAYYLPAWSRLHMFPPSGWEPRLFSGYPVLGDPQAMSWYPLAWASARIPHGWNVFVLCAYVLASSFTYGYVHALTRSRFAAAISGLVFGASGFMVAHLGHTSLIHSAAWFPLVLWSLHELRVGDRARWMTAGAIGVAGMVLGGHPQIALWALAWCGAFALYRGLAAPGGRIEYFACVTTSISIGAAVAAIAWVPAFAMAPETLRGQPSFRFFSSMSMRFDQLPRLILPWGYGGWLGAPFGATNYFGRTPISEVTGFVGLVPLALAAIALADRHRSTVRFWAIAALLGVLFSLGRYVHVFAVLYLIPVYGTFRVPPRHLLLYSMAIAVLCGVGVSHLEGVSRELRRRVSRRAVIVAPLVFSAAGLWIAVQLANGFWDEHLTLAGVDWRAVMPWSNPMVALQAISLGIGIAALAHYCRAPKRAARVFLFGAVVLELWSFGGFTEWRASPTRADLEFPPGLAELRNAVQETHQRITHWEVDGPAFLATPNRNLLWDIPVTLGLGPLPIRRYAEFLGIGGAGFHTDRVFSPNDRTLDLLASRYLIGWSAQLAEARPEIRAALSDRARWRPIRAESGVTVLENRRALPRAWLVWEVVRAQRAEILSAIAGSPLPNGDVFDPLRMALVENDPDLRPESCPRSKCGFVTVVREEDERLELRTEVDRRSVLVVSDTFFEGWTASVDGSRTEIVRTDECLRGLLVPAGSHAIVLEFRPRSRRIGAAVSSAGLVAIAVLGVAAARLPTKPSCGRA